MSPSRPWLLPFLLLLLQVAVSFIRFCYSQSDSQNFEAFYPSEIPVPSPAPSPFVYPPNSTVIPPESGLSPSSSSSSDNTILKAVVATAVSTFVIASLVFFFVRRHVVSGRKRKITDDKSDGGLGPGIASNHQSGQNDGNLEDMIIDENGLDVVYWRKLDGQNNSSSFRKVKSQGPEECHDYDKDEGSDGDQIVQPVHGRRKSNPVHEIPLLRGKSSSSEVKVSYSSEIKVVPEFSMAQPSNDPKSANGAVEKQNVTGRTSNPSPPTPPSFMAVPAKQGPASSPPPPPPPPVPVKKHNLATPSPPPIPVKKHNLAPPPPPPPPPPRSPTTGKKSDVTPAPAPPPPPKAGASGTGGGGSSAGENGNGQVKLKPLHWDKVNKNTDHSMVWDKIGGGSFKVDDDLMEALFGYVATNRRSPKNQGEASASNMQSSNLSAQITILDPKKSQNIAIVLKSLGISHSEVLAGITNGYGLNLETLEGLMRIAPTKEEESLILEFEGDANRLADAEFFLYYILKAIPSAFTRANVLLFRSNYDSEVLQYKESLQTLELGCRELRNRGLFVKLLEAILKAGNRMNAGTSRGNAQAFDLTSLQKLSDVKSTDGKTTLLHFIVEEVVRLEGKRCYINRNRSLNPSNSSRSRSSGNSWTSSETSTSKNEREKEYIMLGLPMVGGLSEEFTNVKKAAQIDYASFAETYSSLVERIAEVRSISSQSAAKREERFAEEMKGFVEEAEEEVKILKEEETRVMELVRKTTEYYQAGASNMKAVQPLQLFVIIKDFLGMVDQVCIEIARNLQKRRTPSSNVGSSSPNSPEERRTPAKFQNLPEHFMKEKSSSSSSESENEF